MNSINYLVGDATQPSGLRSRIIVHVCNDIGGWGAGFVLAVSKRWTEPERRYRAWHRGEDATSPIFGLGQVQFVDVETGITVANLIGQHGIKRADGIPPIRYEAIDQGLATVADEALARKASVHMPRIGCGLAGGHWSAIEPILERRLVAAGVDVTVYDFPPMK